MLRITRKVGEYIVLTIGGKDITIRLDKVDGQQAEMSVGKPDEVNVNCMELEKNDLFDTY